MKLKHEPHQEKVAQAAKLTKRGSAKLLLIYQMVEKQQERLR
jgi:hypothetical protein